MNKYGGLLFKKTYEKYEIGDTDKANSEFSQIEKICKEAGADPNISPEINRFRTDEEDRIMTIQRRYFLAGIDEEKPYAAHIAASVDVTAGRTRINVKFNPKLKPVKLLDKLTEIYGLPINNG